ncbi:hypothetical protein FN846DRAFT_885525 [Sphaerosporella brunnea]|uniref:Uncharacterized protein n=1 Tax=Sphaerosporella brunnea TaxID=1250544 RepID=A0A5J5FBG1_9PEZI|nr:hypothetical protein FN846DRAFT_885525 [Sphaerosporella brunnea]
MPLYYHPPPTYHPPLPGVDPGSVPVFHHKAPVLVDPDPEAQLPLHAPIGVLPFGAPHVGPPPPLGEAPGGFWSLDGYFPIHQDAVPSSASKTVALTEAPAPSTVPVGTFPVSPPQTADILLALVKYQEFVAHLESPGKIEVTPGGALTVVMGACPKCGYQSGKEPYNPNMCSCCIEARAREEYREIIRSQLVAEELAAAKAHAAKLQEEHDAFVKSETIRIAAEKIAAMELKRREDEEAALAKYKEDIAMDEAIRSRAAQIIAEQTAAKEEEARRIAKEKVQAHIAAQYKAFEAVALEKWKAEEAAKAEAAAKKEAEERAIQAAIEEAARKKVEEERIRLETLARLTRALEDHKLAMAEEDARHAEFVRHEQETLAHIEAQKAMLSGELFLPQAPVAVPEPFDAEKERAKIREEIQKEITAHGTAALDTEELRKRLSALKS